MTDEKKKGRETTHVEDAIRRYIRNVEVTRSDPEHDHVFRVYRDVVSKIAHAKGDLGDRYWLNMIEHDGKTLRQAAELEAEIKLLKSSLAEQARSLAEAQGQLQDATRVAELQEKIDQLQEKQKLEFLLSRVNFRAQQLLLDSEEFRGKFLEQKECESFVLSVDIRRSTELMLKARTPEKFAEFITQLCTEFAQIITNNYGVFDKFTGDGVLAFFPEFFAGDDAGILALNTALECHSAFQRHYRAKRSSFSSILTNVGLGIGIDFGKTHLVQMAGGLTVVGVPVVYACRLGNAPAGCTYLNQPAFEQIVASTGSDYSFDEAELEIKHEGGILAYAAKSSGTPVSPRSPSWAESHQRVSGSEV